MKDTRNGSASILNVSLPSEKLLAWKKAQSGLENLKPSKSSKPESGDLHNKDETITAEEVDKLQEEMNFIEDEDYSEGGMMAALRASRQKGYLFENDVEIKGF